LEVSIPQDEEFERLLKDALKKPMKWHEDRAERAVRGSGNVKRRPAHVAHKG
jgi:hypothetical protein